MFFNSTKCLCNIINLIQTKPLLIESLQCFYSLWGNVALALFSSSQNVQPNKLNREQQFNWTAVKFFINDLNIRLNIETERNKM